MKINLLKKLLGLVMLSGFLFSCSHTRTHGKFITEHDDAWMNGYVVDDKGNIDQEDEATQGLVFCRANKKEDGTATPSCYGAKFVAQEND